MTQPQQVSPTTETQRALAARVAERLRHAGYEALFAGGCVRDRLLGRPCFDIDIATSAPPEAVGALFEHTVAVGAQFGVIIVVQDGQPFEVATFRSDGCYIDGRRPSSVSFSDAKTDAQRRDFTINGLFEDPATGEVIDYVGGQRDLELRVIRAIGDARARLTEDKLRVLRGLRFVSQLGFDLEPETQQAIGELATSLRTVAVERIFAELTKLLVGQDRSRALELMRQTGVLAHLLPDVAKLEGVEQPPQYHPEGDCWAHQLLVMQYLPPNPSSELAWGALLHDIGKPPTFTVAERIRFDGHANIGADMAAELLAQLRAPKRFTEVVVELVADHLRFIDVPKMRESTLKRFLRRPTAGLHLDLHKADCQASHGMLETHAFCLQRLAHYRAEGEKEALRPRPLVNGHDLQEAGYRPGPEFKRMLSGLEDAQLEGQVETKDQALAWLSEHFPLPAT